ncbi:MAG TPA: hypothetical protein VE523_02925 [Solirubrobacterales bacterium]|nr:hypothetical protein [Solirubrobacterales bacterium]
MALSDEQRALLQLLLEGGQGYGDIGSLLGISADEARSRARDALREIGGADPDSQVRLSDYLLGQADPIGRADAVRFLQSDSEANAMAGRLVAQLRLIAPRADLPEIPDARGRRGAGRRGGGADSGAGASGAARPEAARRGLSERFSGAMSGGAPSKRRSQLLVGIGALLLLVVVGVLAIAGVLGGDDDGGGGEGTTTAAAGAEDLVIVQLAALQSGSEASGQATFAQIQDQPVLQLNLNGLSPTSGEQIYVVWLYASDRAAFPLARDRVTESGTLTGATPIGSDIAPLLGQFRCIDVSLATRAETEAAIRQAVEGGQALPRHTGESVLRGQVPAEPGGSAPSGADSQCELDETALQGGGQGSAQGGQ